jgi:GDP-D-mannose 3',5'-epimerase
MSRILVTGAGGFIGHHLVTALKERGHWVRGADLKHPEFAESDADEFLILDLRDEWSARMATAGVDEVFALAADMGGMGYITYHDADILTSNLKISVNTVESAWINGVARLTYTSSACIYPQYRQNLTSLPPLAEDMAYPAEPEAGYGWEKLTTEKLLQAYQADGRLDARIARLHNVYGPLGAWASERAKAPAALCRKAAEADTEIEVWGDGQATRSFCYITDCITGLLRLADSDWTEPLNIGSSHLVTVDELARLAIRASGKTLAIRHVEGPQGVRGRNSDNTLCRKTLDWEPQVTLADGMARTYEWVAAQVAKIPA